MSLEIIAELSRFYGADGRFAAAARFRAGQGMRAYPEAADFLAALERGMPECSGCAVGVDRLCMIFCDTCDIADVIFE